MRHVHRPHPCHPWRCIMQAKPQHPACHGVCYTTWGSLPEHSQPGQSCLQLVMPAVTGTRNRRQRQRQPSCSIVRTGRAGTESARPRLCSLEGPRRIGPRATWSKLYRPPFAAGCMRGSTRRATSPRRDTGLRASPTCSHTDCRRPSAAVHAGLQASPSKWYTGRRGRVASVGRGQLAAGRRSARTAA